MKRRTFLQASTILSGVAATSSLPTPAFADVLPFPGPTIDPHYDPFIWLESADSSRALEWSKTRTIRTQHKHATEFVRTTTDMIKHNLDSPDKLVTAARHGDFYYNFWKDVHHPRGIFRRSPISAYLSGHPQWDVLIDVDALCAQESVDWVFSGSHILYPTYDRILVQLSQGGSDALEIREYDIKHRRFIPLSEGGFFIPNGKNIITWIDRDTVLVTTGYADHNSLTDSGYPRSVQRWKRGTALKFAPIIFTIPKNAVSVGFGHNHTPGYEHTFVYSSLDSDRSRAYLVGEHDQLQHIDVPETANINIYKDTLLITVNEPWTIGFHTYPVGSLIAFSLHEYMQGNREATVIFTPTEHSFLQGFAWTKNALLLSVLTDVISHIEVKDLSGNIIHDRTRGIHTSRIRGIPQLSVIDVVDTNPDDDDTIILSSSSFLQPPSLYYGDIHHGVRLLQQSPHRFDATGMSVKQFFARSTDGTPIPYFVVGKLDGTPRPTLMSGYGGFGINENPYYLGTSMGKAWLERGGLFVLANIRGGSEYGPNWHFNSVKAKKYHCYQDFSAVGYDLVHRGLTTPHMLGCRGGSNGGLLVGVMFSQFGDLFQAVVCEIPLLDMYRYVYINAGASWIGEYGDPRIPQEWAWISKYSPYQNVPSPHSNHKRNYPAILLQTTTKDDRVGPGHARKMAARLEAEGINYEFYENFEGGHGTGADNQQVAYYTAIMYDFLWQKLGHGTYHYP